MGKGKPRYIIRLRTIHHPNLDIPLDDVSEEVKLCIREFRMISGEFHQKTHEYIVDLLPQETKGQQDSGEHGFPEGIG